jgi:hypothetical protein
VSWHQTLTDPPRQDEYLILSVAIGTPIRVRVNVQGIAGIIHECRREALETEARRGFFQVRLTEANAQSVEEADRETLCRARGSDDVAGIHE